MMKHCLPDPEQEKNFDNQFTVYSCEYDSGKRSTGVHTFIRLGEDGKVFLFLCESCLEQLNGQIIRPLLIEAMRNDKSIPAIILDSIKNIDKGKKDE
jgi:hypothetical protein